MNVVFFDPTYVDELTLSKLGDILKITEVYSLMPMVRGDYKIKNAFGNKVKLWRRSEETLDNAKKRGVYALLNLVSTPIIVDGNFTGKNVFDVFLESKSDAFSANLDLQDPNVLILLPDRRLDNEESETKFFRYFYNILKKHDSTNRYTERIASVTLSPFVSLGDTSKSELQTTIFSRNSLNFQKNNAQLLSVLLAAYNCNSVKDLRKELLSTAGEQRRIEILKEIEEEERREREEARAYYDDGLTEVQRWGADMELDYIRNNGGDWIDD